MWLTTHTKGIESSPAFFFFTHCNYSHFASVNKNIKGIAYLGEFKKIHTYYIKTVDYGLTNLDWALSLGLSQIDKKYVIDKYKNRWNNQVLLA